LEITYVDGGKKMNTIKNPDTNLHSPGSIGYRLYLLQHLLIKSDAGFALELGISLQMLADLVRARQPLSATLMEKIVQLYGVRATWILRGEGKIFDRKRPATSFNSLHVDNMLDFRDPLFFKVLLSINDPEFPLHQIESYIKSLFSIEEANISKKIKAIKDSPSLTPPIKTIKTEENHEKEDHQKKP